MREPIHLEADRFPAILPWAFFAGVIAFSALLVGWAWWLLSFSGVDDRLPPAAPEAPTLSEVRQRPILLERPAAQIFARQEAENGRFAWIDREEGIVQIPVEDAAELLLREAR